jgi:hypothetical protein
MIIRKLEEEFDDYQRTERRVWWLSEDWKKSLMIIRGLEEEFDDYQRTGRRVWWLSEDWKKSLMIIKRLEEEFDDTKGVIISRKSKKDRQCNGQKKKKTKGQTTIYKTLLKKDRETRSLLKTGCEHRWSGSSVYSSRSLLFENP